MTTLESRGWQDHQEERDSIYRQDTSRFTEGMDITILCPFCGVPITRICKHCPECGTKINWMLEMPR